MTYNKNKPMFNVPNLKSSARKASKETLVRAVKRHMANSTKQIKELGLEN